MDEIDNFDYVNIFEKEVLSGRERYIFPNDSKKGFNVSVSKDEIDKTFKKGKFTPYFVEEFREDGRKLYLESMIRMKMFCELEMNKIIDKINLDTIEIIDQINLERIERIDKIKSEFREKLINLDNSIIKHEIFDYLEQKYGINEEMIKKLEKSKQQTSEGS